jgi:GntR family transcriptional regulator/MocR family aminotransferase
VAVLELAFTPDRDHLEPVYCQLRDYLRELIVAERLPRGAKLPATRELASSLGLSRNTVTQAYEELIADGLAAAHVGQGTFVATTSRPAAPAARTSRATDEARRGFVWSGLFALRARTLTVPSAFTQRPGPRRPIRWDFRGGQVALDTLPSAEMRRAFGQTLGTRLTDVAGLQSPYGLTALRREIARYLVSRGITCDTADVAVVNGAQQAIDLAARVLLDPGDSVVLEQPGYFGARVAFTACQATVIGVDVDDEGLLTDDLARVLRARRVKLIYTTPAAQSPTGVVMSEARRRSLLALADEHQVPILEDDYDSELRYEGPPVAALKTLDRAGQVLYVGTFSKVLFPGLRVGYVVAAPPVLEKMMAARWNADVTTNVVAQAALAHLLATGGLGRHLKRVRSVYATRLAAMLGALAAAMPEGVTWTRPRGGHSVWVTLPAGIDADALLQSAIEAGLHYTSGDVFCGEGRGARQLALSFANLAPAAITAGITLLGDLVRRRLDGQPTKRSTRT